MCRIDIHHELRKPDKKRQKPLRKGEEQSFTIGEAVTTVCERYGYKLGDFYQKRFRDGGYTRGQLDVLYEHTIKRQNAAHRFDAALQGIDLNDKREAPKATTTTDEKGSEIPLFGDPETDYNHLSDEEKEAQTKQMMRHFKGAMSGSPNIGG